MSAKNKKDVERGFVRERRKRGTSEQGRVRIVRPLCSEHVNALLYI